MQIIIEAMHGLGDVVCTLPMIRFVRDKYPDAEITVITKFASGRDIIFASHIRIEKIIVLDIYKDLLESIKVLLSLRESKFDIGISCALTPVSKAKWFMKIVQPHIWYALQKSGKSFDLLNDQYHFVEANFLAICELCGQIPKGEYPELYVDEDDLKHIKERFHVSENKGKTIGVCVGKGDYSLKNRILRTGRVYTRGWGTANMIELVKQLTAINCRVFLIGGQAEVPIVNQIIEKVGGENNIINFVGKTTIRESMAVTSLCDCVVGVDTGMQHIAAAVGTATVSIFGPTNPRTHGAYSRRSYFVETAGNCELQYCYGSKWYIQCSNRRCLKKITVEDVLNQVKKVL